MELMMEPLSNILSSLPSFASSLGIFERLETFLEQTQFHETVSCHGQNLDGTEIPQISSIELRHVPSNTIRLRDASFSGKIGEKAILQDISISIAAGQVYAVTGKVGSGKSLLLQALLGELATVTGDCEVDVSHFGYCSQAVWLFQGTIRDNIIGWVTTDVDEAKYTVVVKACGLDVDFAQLPDGDHTLLTTKGGSLSGGQRHRVVCYEPACRTV